MARDPGSESGVPSRASRLERQLATAQQITHMGSWEWDARTNAVTWSDELYRIYGLEPGEVEVTFDSFLARVHPEDRERIRGEVAAALASGSRFAYGERVVRPDGSIRCLDTVGEVTRDAAGSVVGLIGTCRDVTEERERDRLFEAEQHILEMIASGAPLGEILAAIVLSIEAQSAETTASILLLDPSGTHLRHGAAPNLPAAYILAVDGFAIGPRAGSCGTAVFRREAVFVEDVEQDPLWADHRELIQPFGFRACWSTPVVARDGRVLGTFALYYRVPRLPRPEELKLIGRATHLAGIAVERRQLEEQLRALTAHVESVREEERTGIAREIHDELGQALTALKLDLAWIGNRLAESGDVGKDQLAARIGAMGEMTDEMIGQVRSISARLRPGMLNDLGLAAAIEWQAQEFAARTGMRCTAVVDVIDTPLEREIATAVFRVFQEALTNVVRHAHAKGVDVRLEQTAEVVRLIVSDDGVGISDAAAQSPRSLGLLGIRERARRLGGHATLEGRPGGTTLSLVIPLPGASAV